MLVSRLFLILAFCFSVFAKLSEVSNKSFITRLVKRKGRTGSSGSSISSGSSGSTLISSGQKQTGATTNIIVVGLLADMVIIMHLLLLPLQLDMVLLDIMEIQQRRELPQQTIYFSIEVI